ncbi:hypothetical protein AgCh_014319 [Apium graveolens]
MTSSSCDHYFPEVVICNILSFTKLTSLLRFRSICKLWRSIISKPNFIQAHHSNSLNSPSILMITSAASDYHVAATIVYFDDSNVSPPLPSICSNRMKFVSSCNGIVCVCDNAAENIYLFNPFISMSKKVPPVVIVNKSLQELQERGDKVVKVDVVFGFDCVLNDFKVLRIQYVRVGNSQLVTVSIIEVYSSNADSRRDIEVDVVFTSFVSFRVVLF